MKRLWALSVAGLLFATNAFAQDAPPAGTGTPSTAPSDTAAPSDTSGATPAAATPSEAAATPAPPTSDEAAPSNEPPNYTRSDIIGWSLVGVVTLHQFEHIMRNDYGFPQSSKVEPSFIAACFFYPVFVGGLLLDMGPNYWIIADSLVTIGFTVGHLKIEPPHETIDGWEDRNQNLLGVDSPGLGATGLVLEGLAVAGAVTHLVSNIADGSKYGFTWKHRRTASAPTTGIRAIPTGNGLAVVF